MASESNVKALVITGFGLNCEAETSRAFELAGARAEKVHLNDLLAGLRSLDEFHILSFIGGFAFGDHLGAGTVFANRVRCRLWEPLEKFVSAGKLVIGICNGFQTLTKLGLLPHLPDEPFARRIALADNDRGVFHDGWVHLRMNPRCPSVFLQGIETLEVPVRHGEGKLVCVDAEVRENLEQQNLVAAQYVHPKTGAITDEFPFNPNGSELAAAAISDPSGRILGMMPHPEAYLYPYNHPQWTRRRLDEPLPEHGAGLSIFRNAVGFAARELV